jgi:hypothetical protein
MEMSRAEPRIGWDELPPPVPKWMGSHSHHWTEVEHPPTHFNAAFGRQWENSGNLANGVEPSRRNLAIRLLGPPLPKFGQQKSAGTAFLGHLTWRMIPQAFYRGFLAFPLSAKILCHGLFWDFSLGVALKAVKSTHQTHHATEMCQQTMMAGNLPISFTPILAAG